MKSMSNPVNSVMELLARYLREGQLDKIPALFQQMTDLYQVEQARLEALLDTVNEAVCMIDAANKVVVWNHRAELLYGIKAAEILHQPIGRFFSNLMLSEVMQNHSLVTERYHTPLPETHVLINARPITRDAQIIGGVSTERDITEMVQLNQQLTQTHREMQSLKQTLNEMHSQQDPFSAIYGRGKAIRDAVNIETGGNDQRAGIIER